MNENDICSLVLPDEAEYPWQLTEAYELLELFSDANNTQTLLARNRKSREMATVKCFSSAHPLYGLSEPEALRELNVPPLPRFIAEYKNEQMRCVIRQYVAGETLERYAACQQVSEDQVIAIGVRLCEQLEALHGMQPPIIHRDIKPQNIIMREDDTPVLIDFGIARVLSEGMADTVILGTQGFAPPEQYGFSQTDCRSDIYSLGVVLNWLLHGEAAPPKTAATPLEKTIQRMTAFDPQRRFSSAAQARRALKNAYAPTHRRNRALLMAACLLCVLALAGGIAAGVSARNRRVEFVHPLIADAVRKNLGLSGNAGVTEDMLAKVKGIYIVGDAAYGTADEFYSMIGSWYAAGKNPRGEMTSLQDIERLPNLEQICVVGQELQDISALGRLRNLNKVEFKHNYIQDISPLAGMDRLTSVGLNDNPVQDLSPLLQCPKLAFLDLCDVRTYDPAIIGQLGNFDYLDIANPTESYRYLGQKSILSLSLAWSGLTTLEDLNGVTRLEDMDISHTDVSDLAPITCHAGLRRLKMAAIPVSDLSPLLSLPQLESVTLSEDMRPAAEALGDVSFSIIYE